MNALELIERVRAKHPRTPAVWDQFGRVLWKDPKATHFPSSWKDYATVRLDPPVQPRPVRLPIPPKGRLRKIYSFAKALLAGQYVAPWTVRARLVICESCEHMDKIKEACKICGCPLKIQNKYRTLLRYAETKDYGCPHPDGSRWAAAGC